MSINYQELCFSAKPQDFAEVMKKYNITDKILNESIDQLVTWFEMQPHFPNIKKDDPRLKMTLAVNSFSVENAKRKLENIFTARSVMPEFFANRDIWHEEIKNIFAFIDIVVVPKLTPENYRITITRLSNPKVENFDVTSYFKINSMIGDYRLHYDCTIDSIYIMDYSNLTPAHVSKATPSIMKKYDYLNKECYSSKVKALHLINLPNFVQALFIFAKSMMKKKVAERLHVHTSYESLHKFIPKDCLPKEYGGTYSTCKEIKDNLINGMSTEEWRNRFIEYSNEKSDESKRPENSKPSIEISSLGIEGSFRSLEFD